LIRRDSKDFLDDFESTPWSTHVITNLYIGQ